MKPFPSHRVFSSFGLLHLTGSPSSLTTRAQLQSCSCLDSPPSLPPLWVQMELPRGHLAPGTCLAAAPPHLEISCSTGRMSGWEKHGPRLYRGCLNGLLSTGAPSLIKASRTKDGAINDRTNIQISYLPTLPGENQAVLGSRCLCGTNSSTINSSVFTVPDGLGLETKLMTVSLFLLAVPTAPHV